ncbi:MAG: hypothetical protein U1F34_06850 [Gammaproteobacteria bacterium]
MKYRILVADLFLGMTLGAGAVQAQEPPAQINDEQMKAVMEYAQQVQACMNKVDQSEIEKMQDEGNAREAEVRKLCAAGQRDDAQTKAIAYSKELMAKPPIKEMQQCLKSIKRPQSTGVENEPNSITDFTDISDHQHVCDTLTEEEGAAPTRTNE